MRVSRLSRPLSSFSFSSCIECKGDFPLPAGQPPLSPIDLHLQLFPRESAYLSLFSPGCPVFPRRRAPAPTCVVPSDSRFYFLFRWPQRYPHPPTRFYGRSSWTPQSPEFAVHFIITLDGNKLSKRYRRRCETHRLFSLSVFTVE